MSVRIASQLAANGEGSEGRPRSGEARCRRRSGAPSTACEQAGITVTLPKPMTSGAATRPFEPVTAARDQPDASAARPERTRGGTADPGGPEARDP